MSYCRFEIGFSDVYIYSSSETSFYCHINNNILWECQSRFPEVLVMDEHEYKSQVEVLAALKRLREIAPDIDIPEEAVELLRFEATHGLSGSIQENIDKSFEILREVWSERN